MLYKFSMIFSLTFIYYELNKNENEEKGLEWAI